MKADTLIDQEGKVTFENNQSGSCAAIIYHLHFSSHRETQSPAHSTSSQVRNRDTKLDGKHVQVELKDVEVLHIP